jgi:hypothetical protein
MFDSIDILVMETFIQLVKRGSRISGTEITELYNKVFNKNLKPTNCSSCINQRYKELKNAYDNFMKLLKEEEEKAKALEVLDELMTPTQEELEEITQKKGRKKKGE